MLAGETASKDGYQYALFPLPYLRVTQESGPDVGSHCCGHPNDYGFPYNPYPYYAPCDCHRTGIYAPNGQTWYTSDDKVWTPSGLKYISFLFAHDNSIPAAEHYNQGDLIGHSGDKSSGGAIYPHCHMDQSLTASDAPVYYGFTCPYGNACFALRYSEWASLVFYLTGNEEVVNTGSMTFDTVPEEPEPPEPPEPAPTGSHAIKLLLLYKLRKRRAAYGRRKRNSFLL